MDDVMSVVYSVTRPSVKRVHKKNGAKREPLTV